MAQDNEVIRSFFPIGGRQSNPDDFVILGSPIQNILSPEELQNINIAIAALKIDYPGYQFPAGSILLVIVVNNIVNHFFYPIIHDMPEIDGDMKAIKNLILIALHETIVANMQIIVYHDNYDLEIFNAKIE